MAIGCSTLPQGGARLPCPLPECQTAECQNANPSHAQCPPPPLVQPQAMLPCAGSDHQLWPQGAQGTHGGRGSMVYRGALACVAAGCHKHSRRGGCASMGWGALRVATWCHKGEGRGVQAVPTFSSMWPWGRACPLLPLPKGHPASTCHAPRCTIPPMHHTPPRDCKPHTPMALCHVTLHMEYLLAATKGHAGCVGGGEWHAGMWPQGAMRGAGTGGHGQCPPAVGRSCGSGHVPHAYFPHATLWLHATHPAITYPAPYPRAGVACHTPQPQTVGTLHTMDAPHVIPCGHAPHPHTPCVTPSGCTPCHWPQLVGAPLAMCPLTPQGLRAAPCAMRP